MFFRQSAIANKLAVFLWWKLWLKLKLINMHFVKIKINLANLYHNKKWERLCHWKCFFNSYVCKILSNYFKKSVRCSAKPKHRSSPPEGFLWKGVLRNMQQIYRITTMLKHDFNTSLQHGCSVNLLHNFQSTFSYKQLWKIASVSVT